MHSPPMQLTTQLCVQVLERLRLWWGCYMDMTFYLREWWAVDCERSQLVVWSRRHGMRWDVEIVWAQMWCSAHLSGAQLLWLSASPDAALLRQVQPTVILVRFFKQPYVVIAILCDLVHPTVCDSDSLERHYYLVICLLVTENHDNPELRPGGRAAVLHAPLHFLWSSYPS